MLFRKHRCHLDSHEPRDVFGHTPCEQRSETRRCPIAPKRRVLKSVFKNDFYTAVNQTDLTIIPFYLTFLHKAEVSTPLGKPPF